MSGYPNLTPQLLASELQTEDTVACLQEQPAARDSQLPKSLLCCKTNFETSSEGYKGAGKLPSSYIPKQEKVKALQFRYLLLWCCLPTSFKFPFFPLISAFLVTYLTLIWEYFENDHPSDSLSCFFPGCWFWAQVRAFVVMPLHLNPVLTTAHQVLAEGLLTHDSYSLLWKSWTGIQGQALSPWADTVSHYGLEGSFSETER